MMLSPRMKSAIDGLEPSDAFEAFMSVAAGIFYFINHPKEKASIVVLLAGLIGGGSNFYALYDWKTTERAEVEKLSPVTKPTSSNFSLMPKAYAGDQPCDSIKINGRFYGVWGAEAKDLKLYRVCGQPGTAILYNSTSGDVVKISIPDFQEIMKQSK